ncbi:Dabb family protein [Paenibacillus sp. TRM 82003]|nr:Dabb family protein [Paenibacillus sp. TRM 82003]
MTTGRIRHMAIFTLLHPEDAPETRRFLQDGQSILSAIPTVENFEVVHQVSPKNEFRFGFSMEFADQAAYDAYNVHPAHVDFVENRWKKEVAKFQEIDFAAYAAD